MKVYIRMNRNLLTNFRTLRNTMKQKHTHFASPKPGKQTIQLISAQNIPVAELIVQLVQYLKMQKPTEWLSMKCSWNYLGYTTEQKHTLFDCPWRGQQIVQSASAQKHSSYWETRKLLPTSVLRYVCQRNVSELPKLKPMRCFSIQLRYSTQKNTYSLIQILERDSFSRFQPKKFELMLKLFTTSVLKNPKFKKKYKIFTANSRKLRELFYGWIVKTWTWSMISRSDFSR